MLIDTHTHLYLPEFNEDRELMLQRARDAGVKKFYLPNIDSESIPAMFQLADRFPEECYPMMGLHPCSVGNKYAEDLRIVEHWLGKRDFSAIGEIGIDLFWDKSFVDQQIDAFRHQIRLGKKYGLPIVIHTRNSFEESFRVVKEEHHGALKGIFHCFSGTAEQAQRVMALGGFMLGVGGVVTFKNSGLEQVIREVGLEAVVLETDAPYLAPVPYRGKRNEPAYLLEVVRKLSEITGKTPEEVSSITTANALTIFGK